MTMTDMDKDLRSIQQARDLAVGAREAMRQFQFADQETVDRICQAMVDAAMAEAGRLGQMAHEETGFGYPEHKKLKNEFAAQGTWDNIKDQKTCGVLREDHVNNYVEIGWPVGVVVALTPSTNPTSTAIFKILLAVKARNGVVVAPHPSARKCTAEAARIMAEAGEAAGMPKGLVSCMTELSMPGTQELLSHYATSLILATGGPDMVKSAHSQGKPAFGVGPGNVPVFVDRSADVAKAAEMIVQSKSFDCSTICATEQTVIADRPIADQLKAEMQRHGAQFLSREETEKLTKGMFRPNGLMVASMVGRTPQALGEMVGIDVPQSTRILVCPLDGVGPEHPISREKLTTVLGWMVEDGWQAGLDRSIQILRFGGDGHSAAIHSRDEDSIMAFGVQTPAFRVLVNTWSSLGGVGYTTGLNPSYTLGPGGVGGSAVSENVTLKHVLNIKRLARQVTEPPAVAKAHGGLLDGKPSSSSGSATASEPDIEAMVRKIVAELQKRGQ